VLQLLGGGPVSGVSWVSGTFGAWVACCALAIGCGASQPKASGMAPSAREGGGVPAEPHAEIDALDRQITDELAQAHVPQPVTAACTGAACAEAMSQPFTTPSAADAQCHPATTDRCTSACTLSTSICNNQQKICGLAKQLPGDDWAAHKCETARASCQAAHDSCCSCVL
jgi:hypothetical protein